MSENGKTTVTVEIAGEHYTIRTQASPEHATRCAALVDQALSDVQRQGPLVEAHKAVILAALTLADELLQARDAAHDTRARQAERSQKLALDLESVLDSSDLASRQ